MKVALLISGYLRSFKVNVPLIKEKIIDRFDNVDVYIHITKNEGIEDKYLNKYNEYESFEFLNKVLNPKCIIHEPNINFSKNKKENDLMNHWLKYFKINQIKKNNEELFGEYDLVIKYRPDLELISDINFDDIEENVIFIPKDSKIDKDKLLNVDDNFICDIFAYGKSKIMDNYFSFYEKIIELSEKFGFVSETLLFHYLINNKIQYKLIDIEYGMILSMCNVFAIAGDSGSGKTTLGNILKKYFSNSIMLECDRYHKWERGNDNWKHFTHLNPEANFITKMSNDIFDLKIGKDIYQVNYDHKNGKFTDKEHIQSTDNIIVCGLHSLYLENEHLYNLKIFMDTDKKLRTDWKVKRDVHERGYDLDKVLKQITDRETDYITYVDPQKYKSDIIINFYTDENNNLKLKILIKKIFDIKKIINQFNFFNIKNQIIDTGEFTQISFTEFKESDLLKNYPFKLNNFYDYILYLILNINYN